MASLSDLAAGPADNSCQSAPPEWINALSQTGGFVAGSPYQEDAPNTSDINCTEVTKEDKIAEAYTNGELAGRAAAMAEHAADNSAREALSLQFSRLDEVASATLAEALRTTVTNLCVHLIEPHLIDAASLNQRCIDAVNQLGQLAGTLSLQLHPEDIPMLAPECAQNWKIRENPEMLRGSLRLESSDGSVTDGPEEWRRAIITGLRA